MKLMTMVVVVQNNTRHNTTRFYENTMRKMSTWQIAITMANITRILVWEILVKASTRGNIHQLHAAADAKRGNVFLQRPGGEGQFDFIKPGITRHFKIWMGVFTIALGLHISPT